MSIKKKIVLVDDEALNLKILEEILSPDYDLLLCESGDQCIEYLNKVIDIQDNLPDLILMDVKMPGLGGLECCKTIKSNPETAEIPVIFISALSQLEDRMSGYDVGGDDYIPKPFDDNELKIKIHRVMENHHKYVAKSQGYKEAMSTAMTALTNASEIGNILRFFHEIFSIHDIEKVAQTLFRIINSYGLQATLAIDIENEEPKVFTSQGPLRPLEVSVIEELRGRERLFHFGSRTLISMDCVCLLVLNMPVENEEMYGRIKDHLAMITEGLDSRLKALSVELERNHQRHKLLTLVTMVQELITNLEKAQEAHQQEHAALINDLIDKVDESFVYLGLTEEQENSLTSLIRESEEKASHLFDKEARLNMQFSAIKKMLEET